MTTWIDQIEYPFEHRYIETELGKIHYIDEGKGPVIVFVHGNPTWSFVYRDMIKGLKSSYRCVALDLLGFGLSDKPKDCDYRPKTHGKLLQTFIETLDLQDITLVMQDWGGPIGFSYAGTHAANIKKIMLMNTWCWSVKGDMHYEAFSRIMGGRIGQWLIRTFNIFVTQIMPKATQDKTSLTAPILNHYVQPIPTTESRIACAKFPHSIIAESQWLDQVWTTIQSLREVPTLICWGMKDIAFREKELNRWRDLFASAEIHCFQDAGHYVQQEKAKEIIPIMQHFMTKTPKTS